MLTYVVAMMIGGSSPAHAGDELLNVADESMIKAPAYGFTFEVNLVEGTVLLGPPGTCAPATQAQIAMTYSAGKELVQSGKMTTWDIKEKLLLDRPDRVLLRSGAYAKRDGEPKLIQHTYFDQDRARCDQLLSSSEKLLETKGAPAVTLSLEALK